MTSYPIEMPFGTLVYFETTIVWSFAKRKCPFWKITPGADWIPNELPTWFAKLVTARPATPSLEDATLGTFATGSVVPTLNL